ncbi:hypothetical protein EGI16_10100 [Chryseobacterium sp. G0240]|uniref:hypothetical protein n=1 Tax=Chryseobacterium sp. G0240 TaxID=2487066 RepID=UPI000F45775C|nr:hypothetical protein [Chryseobacterium sp. G0240]ROI04142.1 hypothetical protein EGI16_10100 [Chryseobacterium sp. G0240]
MKSIIIAILCFLCAIVNAQSKYDTISFSNVLLNNKALYTEFKYLRNIINDKDNRAKVYPSKDINIPFKEFGETEILYSIFSDNIVYNYSGSEPNNVYITYIKPNSYFKVKIGGNLLKKNTNISLLKKWYPNSYKSYITDKNNNFRLIVRKDNKYAFLDLIFKNSCFQELYLVSE